MMPQQPLTESEIIFPHLFNTPNLSSTLSSLKRSTLSVQNRLKSIISDSEFVVSVAEAYGLPLVANERCGSWYIAPERKFGSVYFKSTDGHMGQWGFSLRRLNFQLFDIVAEHDGAIIVDSTRRGKSMPDALSKTVPMWCCVINRAVFAEAEHELFTPPQAVGESEHLQMSNRIDAFVKQFLEICKPNIKVLRSKLRKPLRPIWVTQTSILPETIPSFPHFHPIVLCTASRRVEGGEASENGYIQGAADDHEAWSHGLTPATFWKHKCTLIEPYEGDVSELVADLLKQEMSTTIQVAATLVRPTSTIYISSTQNLDMTGFRVVISCTLEEIPLRQRETAGISNYLHLKCQQGKLGSRDLRNEFNKLSPFLKNLGITPSSLPPNVLICCTTGKDLAVGTALAILCRHVDDAGHLNLQTERRAVDINKNLIKQRLSWITTSNPALNPSRATLQSVNAILLASQDPKLRQGTPSICSKPTDTRAIVDVTSGIPVKLPLEPHPGPGTIFSTFAGYTWTFYRTLSSKLSSHPSGTVKGTATLTPCSLPASFPPTLLYAEEGDFLTDTGLRFSAKRKYVYQLVESTVEGAGKTIVIKFFDGEKLPRRQQDDGLGENGEAIGGLFVGMNTLLPMGSGSSTGGDVVVEVKSQEQHLCAEDLYNASWRFGPAMLQACQGRDADLWWEVRYDVKGPKKDYVSVTRYGASSEAPLEPAKWKAGDVSFG